MTVERIYIVTRKNTAGVEEIIQIPESQMAAYRASLVEKIETDRQADSEAKTVPPAEIV